MFHEMIHLQAKIKTCWNLPNWNDGPLRLKSWMVSGKTQMKFTWEWKNSRFQASLSQERLETRMHLTIWPRVLLSGWKSIISHLVGWMLPTPNQSLTQTIEPTSLTCRYVLHTDLFTSHVHAFMRSYSWVFISLRTEPKIPGWQR